MVILGKIPVRSLELHEIVGAAGRHVRKSVGPVFPGDPECQIAVPVCTGDGDHGPCCNYPVLAGIVIDIFPAAQGIAASGDRISGAVRQAEGNAETLSAAGEDAVRMGLLPGKRKSRGGGLSGTRGGPTGRGGFNPHVVGIQEKMIGRHGIVGAAGDRGNHFPAAVQDMTVSYDVRSRKDLVCGVSPKQFTAGIRDVDGAKRSRCESAGTFPGVDHTALFVQKNREGAGKIPAGNNAALNDLDIVVRCQGDRIYRSVCLAALRRRKLDHIKVGLMGYTVQREAAEMNIPVFVRDRGCERLTVGKLFPGDGFAAVLFL